MEKTSQYQLNQSAAEDRILREDFNRDNANVEAGLVALGERVTAEQSAREAAITAEQEARDSAVTAAKNEAAASDAQLNAVKVEIATGYYRGNGAESRFISLGRTPKALLLFREDGLTIDEYSTDALCGGLILAERALQQAETTIADIVENGFNVYYSSTDKRMILTNHSNYVYHYLAFF